MTTLCPVCGLSLGFAPWVDESPSDGICPCCGIQFGYDDSAPSAEERQQYYDEWRTHWINNGMQWFSRSQPPPNGWDHVTQLRQLARSSGHGGKPRGQPPTS